MKYQANSPTSRAAAISMLDTSDSLRALVYRYIAQAADGATDEEMQRSLQINPSTQRPRRVELVELGVVKDSGCVRKTLSNRDAVVWVVCEPSASRKNQGELF